MSAGLAAISPITSSFIFSTRRANNGVEAINASNPLVGAMNLDIAGGQITNAAKGVADIARESKNAIATEIISAEKSIKALGKADKFMRGCGKVLQFTADNINPLICATGVVKVACSDNKVDEGITEGAAIGTMLGVSEPMAKRILGLGKHKEGLYKKNPFLAKQADVVKDYCETTKLFNKVSLKALPGIGKGLGFVAASIGGYQLGHKIGTEIVEYKNQVS